MYVWAVALRVDAVVHTTAALPDGSKSPRTQPSFPSLHPPAPSTLMIHLPPPAPLRLHRDSHPLPRTELSLRSLGELHHSSSIFGYHQTSIWAETSAWLHSRDQLSSFYETACVRSHTRTHTHRWLWWPFAGRVFHLKMLECLQVTMQDSI